MEDKIEVLMATYNGEKYLKEQIESILNQTYENIKLIISDDCSQDGTRDILKEYENNDRVKLIFQEKNLGYIKNFEFLLSQVQEEYYMLSDQDDIWKPEKIEKSIKTLKTREADLVFGDLEVVDENLNTIYPSFNNYMKLTKKIESFEFEVELNYLYNCITGCTVLSRRKFIKDIIPIPNKSKYVAHDHWMGLIISTKGKLVYMPEKLIKYRQHGDNEIGTEKISHKFTKLDDVRKLFIDVKLGVFGTYVENNNRFPNQLQELNTKAYNYFKMVENKKNFNFKNWGVFHKLYKTENFLYYIENFIIMNLPFIGRGLFKIRHLILKLIGKR